MRQRLRAWFWDHFHPDRKRHPFIRKLRFVDGWFTRMESKSPHALPFLLKAEKAVCVNHPPTERQREMKRRREAGGGLGSGEIAARAFAEWLSRHPEEERDGPGGML